MKLVSRIFLYVKRILIFFKRNEFKITLPAFYIFFSVSGYLLNLFTYFYPEVVVCFNGFGNKICTNPGVIISSFISLPGYIIVGKVFGGRINEVSLAISFFLVIGVSTLFYFFIGALIDKIKKIKFSIRFNSSTLVFYVFIILSFLLAILLNALKSQTR